MNDTPASEQIDDIIKQHGGWKGEVISRLRTIIQKADKDIVESIKWKMKTRPEGLPVWEHAGIVCFVEIWKDNIKLIFFKGAQLNDSNKLFNARLNSATLRAIEIREGDSIDEGGIQALIVQAVRLNSTKN